MNMAKATGMAKPMSIAKPMGMAKRLRVALGSLLLCLALVSSTGCFRGNGRAVLGALHVAAAITEVIVIASILASHDAHYHGGHCHPVRVYDGRQNYYYNGHWEYYDDGGAVWYSY